MCGDSSIGVPLRLQYFLIPKQNSRPILCSLLSVLLIGCAVDVSPLTEGERSKIVEEDRAKIFDASKPTSDSITIYDAVARALKYNLQHRANLMAEKISQGSLDLANLDMLPELAANVGYTDRSNKAASSSQSVTTGVTSLETSTSQEQSRKTANLSLTWNILDFGVSYYNALQSADQSLADREARRRTVHNIIAEVTAAFWDLAVAQAMADDIEFMRKRAETALANAEDVEFHQLDSVIVSLTYRRDLLETIQTMERLHRENKIARARFSELINLRPGAPILLDLGILKAAMVPKLDRSMGEFEKMALLNRPDMGEAIYNTRIASHEVRKELLRMLPGIELNTDFNHDSNKFNLNNEWYSWGGQITGNLFDIIRGPTRRDVAVSRVTLAETQRMALHLAILAQVHVSMHQYEDTMRQLELATNLSDIELDIAFHRQNQFKQNSTNESEFVRAEVRALLAKMRMYNALSDLHGAHARIMHTVGIDPLPGDVTSDTVYEISDKLRLWFKFGIPAGNGSPAAHKHDTSKRHHRHVLPEELPKSEIHQEEFFTGTFEPE